MPVEDVVEAVGVPRQRRLGRGVELPAEELAFVTCEALEKVLTPEALNGGNVVDIYQQREEDLMAFQTLEVTYKTQNGEQMKEILYVDTLNPSSSPRVCVSVDNVKAMHRAITVLSRKVDNLGMTLRSCREHYYKELLHLRHGLIPDHQAYWFNPKAYEDNVTKAVIREKLSGKAAVLQAELDEKEKELLKLRNGLSEMSKPAQPKGDISELRQLLGTMPFDQIFHMLKGVNESRMGSYYKHLEKALNEREEQLGPSASSNDLRERLEESEAQVRDLTERLQHAMHHQHQAHLTPTRFNAQRQRSKSPQPAIEKSKSEQSGAGNAQQDDFWQSLMESTKHIEESDEAAKQASRDAVEAVKKAAQWETESKKLRQRVAELEQELHEKHADMTESQRQVAALARQLKEPREGRAPRRLSKWQSNKGSDEESMTPRSRQSIKRRTTGASSVAGTDGPASPSGMSTSERAGNDADAKTPRRAPSEGHRSSGEASPKRASAASEAGPKPSADDAGAAAEERSSMSRGRGSTGDAAKPSSRRPTARISEEAAEALASAADEAAKEGPAVSRKTTRKASHGAQSPIQEQGEDAPASEPPPASEPAAAKAAPEERRGSRSSSVAEEPAASAEDQLQAITGECPHEGCGLTMKLTELLLHASRCGHRIVTCPNKSCGQYVKAKFLNMHRIADIMRRRNISFDATRGTVELLGSIEFRLRKVVKDGDDEEDDATEELELVDAAAVARVLRDVREVFSIFPYQAEVVRHSCDPDGFDGSRANLVIQRLVAMGVVGDWLSPKVVDSHKDGYSIKLNLRAPISEEEVEYLEDAVAKFPPEAARTASASPSPAPSPGASPSPEPRSRVHVVAHSAEASASSGQQGGMSRLGSKSSLSRMGSKASISRMGSKSSLSRMGSKSSLRSGMGSRSGSKTALAASHPEGQGRRVGHKATEPSPSSRTAESRGNLRRMRTDGAMGSKGLGRKDTSDSVGGRSATRRATDSQSKRSQADSVSSRSASRKSTVDAVKRSAEPGVVGQSSQPAESSWAAFAEDPLEEERVQGDVRATENEEDEEDVADEGLAATRHRTLGDQDTAAATPGPAAKRKSVAAVLQQEEGEQADDEDDAADGRSHREAAPDEAAAGGGSEAGVIEQQVADSQPAMRILISPDNEEPQQEVRVEISNHQHRGSGERPRAAEQHFVAPPSSRVDSEAEGMEDQGLEQEHSATDTAASAATDTAISADESVFEGLPGGHAGRASRASRSTPAPLPGVVDRQGSATPAQARDGLSRLSFAAEVNFNESGSFDRPSRVHSQPSRMGAESVDLKSVDPTRPTTAASDATQAAPFDLAASPEFMRRRASPSGHRTMSPVNSANITPVNGFAIDPKDLTETAAQTSVGFDAALPGWNVEAMDTETRKQMLVWCVAFIEKFQPDLLYKAAMQQRRLQRLSSSLGPGTQGAGQAGKGATPEAGLGEATKRFLLSRQASTLTGAQRLSLSEEAPPAQSVRGALAAALAIGEGLANFGLREAGLESELPPVKEAESGPSPPPAPRVHKPPPSVLGRRASAQPKTAKGLPLAMAAVQDVMAQEASVPLEKLEEEPSQMSTKASAEVPTQAEALSSMQFESTLSHPARATEQGSTLLAEVEEEDRSSPRRSVSPPDLLSVPGMRSSSMRRQTSPAEDSSGLLSRGPSPLPGRLGSMSPTDFSSPIYRLMASPAPATSHAESPSPAPSPVPARASSSDAGSVFQDLRGIKRAATPGSRVRAGCLSPTGLWRPETAEGGVSNRNAATILVNGPGNPREKKPDDLESALTPALPNLRGSTPRGSKSAGMTPRASLRPSSRR